MGRIPSDRHFHIAQDGLDRDVAPRCLLEIDGDVPPRIGLGHEVVDVHKVWDLLEPVGHLLGDLPAGCRIWAVYLRDKGLQYRRARRHLDDRQPRTGGPGDRA